MGNSVYIGGIVKAPVYFDDNNHLSVDLKIYRTDLKKYEDLTIIAMDKSVIEKAIQEIQEGMYFLTTDAYLKTTTYLRKKELECSECYKVDIQRVKSERTEAIFRDFMVFQVSEGSEPVGVNKVTLYGNVCNDLNYRQKDGRSYCKYKLAVNQKVYDTDAEYPFIVTFGKDADLSHKYIKRNSRVVIEGSIQQRIIKQKTEHVCTECGIRATKFVPNYVREIITCNVIFLDKDNNEADLEGE